MTTLAAWVVSASLLVTDAHGVRPLKPIPEAGATAIAAVCSRTSGPAMCAAVYVVMAFRESGYRLDAVGDGGRSHGPFQTAKAPSSWADAVAIWTPILQRSAAACEEPLEMLATGRCGTAIGKAISRARMKLARDIITALPWKGDDT